jgi:porphobilinogen synthase
VSFPASRPRRLRQNDAWRRLVRETELSPSHFLQPFFVCPGRGVSRPVKSMPGVSQFSVDRLVREAKETRRLGIPGILLFGIPSKKDATGSDAYDPDGIVQRAVRAVKDAAPDLLVFTDLCFCEYTDHGHCGILRPAKGGRVSLDNDATLDIVARAAVAQAEAGADAVAPSGMMDGAVRAIRRALDGAGRPETVVMAYSAKYTSAFYGPFRDAAESAPRFGDRKTYQMDPPNAREALREVALDVEEGADIVMVKPALAYLDVIRAVKDRFSLPVAAYNVSGEYSMVKAAAERGWVDGAAVTREILTAIRRAGADILITYHAREAARSLL